MSETYNDLMKETYARRAATYDESTGGYHIGLARDFVQLIDPQPGEKCLDVACGTGLVAIDMAARVGATGQVVAVDWSPEMQAVGKAKLSAAQLNSGKDSTADIEWVLADITSEKLLEEEPVKKVLEEHGGFDVITMCQGYMQLPDLEGAIRFWAQRLLRKGGRMISDMTTEDPSLQYLVTYHLPVALDLSVNLSSGRVYITDQQSFENLFKAAGLEVVQTVKTKLYGPPRWFEADEKTASEVLEQEIERNLPWHPEEDKVKEAREKWPQIWKKVAMSWSDGSQGIEGRHPFYICIARKPQ